MLFVVLKVCICGKGKYEFLNRPLKKLYLLEVSSSEIDRWEKEKNVDGDKCAKTRMQKEKDPRGGAKLRI